MMRIPTTTLPTQYNCLPYYYCSSSVLYSPFRRPSLAEEKNLLGVWSEIKMPPVVAVQPVHLDPKTSALLILDIEEWTYNAERHPRCPDSVPRIKAFLGHK